MDQHSWVLIKRLIRDHVRPHSTRIVLALLCMGLVAATTGALAWVMEPLLNGAFKDANYAALYFYAPFILAVFVVKGASTYGQAVIMNYVGQRILADMQIRLYDHLIHADMAFLQRHPTGTLISRFNNDVQLMRMTVSTVLTSIGKDTLTLIGLVGVMFYQDWLLASLTFFVFPAAVVPVVRLGRRMRRVSADTQVELGQFTTQLDESFQGARHVKAYGMEDYEVARARRLIDRVFDLVYKAARVRSLHHPIMETLGGFAIVAVILYGGWQVIDQGKQPGALFSFVTALLLAYEPAKKLANLNTNLQEGLAAAQRVFALLDSKPEIVDRPGARVLETTAGAIAFEGVRFAYEGSDGAPALRDITLDIPAGRKVALVGPSGAGKSTIFNLIPRFYDVSAGRVTMDGIDVRDVTLASLRARIGLVSQEISLFDDSVRANIAYGRLDASETEIVAAAKAASAHDFIAALPAGYDTQVGGRGMRLSGGQRQRIAIARAMLKNAPVLLLDEATSSLDTESEHQVQAALATLMRDRTTLVIAHRLSTVIDADVIYVIENGTVREHGSHAALLARGGAYARLYALQLADAEAEATPDAEAPADDDAAGSVSRPRRRARV